MRNTKRSWNKIKKMIDNYHLDKYGGSPGRDSLSKVACGKFVDKAGAKLVFASGPKVNEVNGGNPGPCNKISK